MLPATPFCPLVLPLIHTRPTPVFLLAPLIGLAHSKLQKISKYEHKLYSNRFSQPKVVQTPSRNLHLCSLHSAIHRDCITAATLPHSPHIKSLCIGTAFVGDFIVNLVKIRVMEFKTYHLHPETFPFAQDRTFQCHEKTPEGEFTTWN